MVGTRSLTKSHDRTGICVLGIFLLMVAGGCAGKRELRVVYPPSEVPDGKTARVLVVSPRGDGYKW